jgi:undecaprenyl phosphate-alpha-L-ara4N flippase subunit ArnE
LGGETPAKKRPWYLQALWQLLFVTVMMSAYELLTKYGADQALKTVPAENFFARLGMPAVANVWTWVGTGLACVAFGAWLHVLKRVPLSLAFTISQGTFVLVPLGAWLFLGEQVSAKLWIGIALVVAGVILLVPDLVKEERMGEER